MNDRRMPTGHVTRRSALAAAMAVATPLAAACGAQTEAPQAKRTQPITLDTWSRLASFKGLADVWNAGPGAAAMVTVAFTQIASPLEFQNKLITAAASNTTPDFTTVELNITPALNTQKLYADVSKDVARLKVKDQFPPAMARYGTHEGKTYQIPFWVDASGLFYNKNLFQSVGLPDQAPKSWDDLARSAQLLTRGDVAGVTIPYNGSATWMFMPWVYANGGRLVSDDGKKSQLNSEEALGAFTLWHDLSTRRQLTPAGFRSKTTFNASELFTQGKLGIYHAGVGFLNTLKKDAPGLSFGTAVLPVGPRGKKTGCSPGGDTIGMLPSNKYKAETWKLMEWLISAEAQVEYFVQGRYGIPILSGQFDNKYFKEEPRFLPFRESAQAATATWTTRFEEIKAVMVPEYMAVLTGDKDPKTAQRDMHDAVDRELAKA